MTPKEKAQELYNKFHPIVSVWEAEYGYDRTHGRAKEAAIVAVDELLFQLIGLHKPEYCAFDAIGKRKFTFEGAEYDTHMTGYDMTSYWQQVKDEIEKL